MSTFDALFDGSDPDLLKHAYVKCVHCQDRHKRSERKPGPPRKNGGGVPSVCPRCERIAFQWDQEEQR